MDTFPEINSRVKDSKRVFAPDDVLTVVSVNYATGDVTLRHVTHARTYPYGRPAEGGVLEYSRHMSHLISA